MPDCTCTGSAYQGASGPAIGGDSQDASIHPVADPWLRLIEGTPPAGFEAVFYDDDTDDTIAYGCKDGEWYWTEVPDGP